MAFCDAQTLMGEADEFNTLSPQTLQVIDTILLIKILKALDAMADCSRTALLAEATEFSSLPTHTLLVIIAQLLCNISAVGVGGVTPQVLRGTGAPAAAPSGANAIYLDGSADAEIVLYWWKDTEWIPFG